MHDEAGNERERTKRESMKKYEQTIQTIHPLDHAMEPKVQVHLDDLTKPQGSFGRLEELATFSGAGVESEGAECMNGLTPAGAHFAAGKEKGGGHA